MLKDLLQAYRWYSGIVLVSMFLFVSGCTAPTQRIAAAALSRGIEQDKSIVTDLVKMNKQHIGERYLDEVKRAVIASDGAAAEAAYIAALNEYNKISWLQIQHERTRALFLIGVRYINEQQGIVDILKEEYNEAKATAEVK